MKINTIDKLIKHIQNDKPESLEDAEERDIFIIDCLKYIKSTQQKKKVYENDSHFNGIKIGKFYIEPDAFRKGKILIEANGNGGEFSQDEFENLLIDFFNKNF
jgi:hypothetical protein